MPGYLESILDISESCDYFLPWNVVKEKLTLAGRGGGIPENVAVGVREAVRLQSNTGGQRFFKCSCQIQVRDEEVLVSQGWSSMQLPLP